MDNIRESKEYKRIKDSIDAVMMIETEELTENEFCAALQKLIDLDLILELQGMYGRTAKNLIEAGKCQPKEEGKC